MPYRLLPLPVILLVQAAIAQSHYTARLPAAQSIDSLRTPDQVLAFVKGLEKYDTNVSLHRNNPLYGGRVREKRRQDFGALPYEKADLDGNGYTDLLFNGYQYQQGYSFPWTRIILWFGGDSLRVIGWHKDLMAAKAIRLGDQLSIRTLRADGIDTLVWFQDNFIERVPPQKHRIQEIRYEFCPCGLSLEGSFHMTIYGDSVKLITDAAISPGTRVDSGGFFVARLDTALRHRLYALLERVDFPHLMERYHSQSTDQPMGELEITYDQGKRKTISFDGLEGTWGMSALHALLLELEDTLSWTKID